MKTTKQLFTESTAISAEALADFSLKLRTVSEKLHFKLFDKMPPSVSDDKKWRDDRDIEITRSIIAWSLIDGCDSMGAIAQALKKNDSAFLSTLAEMSKDFKQPQHTKFSRSVVFAISAKLNLHRKNGRLPTKNEVIKLAAKTARNLKLSSFDETADCATRWTEVFRIAGLQYLPKDKPRQTANRQQQVVKKKRHTK